MNLHQIKNLILKLISLAQTFENEFNFIKWFHIKSPNIYHKTL